MRKPTAFLLMPFDSSFDWLHAEIVAGGAEAGLSVVRADNIFRAGVVIDQVRDGISQADTVIAVCTGRNANVFYELGMVQPSKRPILIAETKNDLPFDIHHFRAQFYGGNVPAESRSTLRQRLTAALRETVAESLSEAHLRARAVKRADGYVFEICNDGHIPLTDIKWQSSPELPIMLNTLHRYPVAVLEPGDCQTALMPVSMGSPGTAEVTLEGIAPTGHPYRRTQVVSIFG